MDKASDDSRERPAHGADAAASVQREEFPRRNGARRSEVQFLAAPQENKENEMKQIIVEYGVVRKLCEEFHTSRVTVGAALRLRTNTTLACKIRQRAFQLGGVMMEAERVRKEGAACI